ncbi:MAG TPA: hypothetical protein VK756_10970 [Solirubrobacteraceae bacterium]|nr:hypothetical protein [Solirubrobacteraceae bacterium]
MQTLLPSARAFACQSGYYRFDALASFGGDVQRMLAGGGRFDLVVGANEERLSAPDLQQTLDLLGSHVPADASFTLVGACNGLFHPKAYYVELVDGSRHAAVGSANFTIQGTGHHVEACVLLDDGVDDPSVLDAVRDAILAWRGRAAAGAAGARRVTERYIRQLEAERIIDPVSAPPGGGGSSGGRSSFPPLSRIQGAPGPRRKARRARRSAPGAHLRGAPEAFPSGVVGIVKRLSPRNDVKGFRPDRGTPYISLTTSHELANRLPMSPFGKNSEPRLDLALEARLYEAAKDVVGSGTDTTNITFVGTGATRSGHPDLRFNIHHTVVAGLQYVASRRGLAIPRGGDFMAVEFLEEGRLARLTFVSTDPLRGVLRQFLKRGRGWGWLPAGIVPDW